MVSGRARFNSEAPDSQVADWTNKYLPSDPTSKVANVLGLRITQALNQTNREAPDHGCDLTEACVVEVLVTVLATIVSHSPDPAELIDIISSTLQPEFDAALFAEDISGSNSRMH
jgi:hypothetical protein